MFMLHVRLFPDTLCNCLFSVYFCFTPAITFGEIKLIYRHKKQIESEGSRKAPEKILDPHFMETGTFYPDRYHILVGLLLVIWQLNNDQPGRFLFCKIEEEAIAPSCLLLAIRPWFQ